MGLFGFPSKKERELQKQEIQICNRILVDSLKIMNSTSDIDTFLSRYQDAKSAVQEASKIAGPTAKCMVQNSTPEECMESLKRDVSQALIPCIGRYMRKQTIRISNLSRGRMSKAKGLYLQVDEYEKDIPPDAADYWRRSIDKLIQKIERLDEQS